MNPKKRVRDVTTFILYFLTIGFCDRWIENVQAQTAAPGNVDIRIVTDEAEAVLAILGRRSSGQPVAEADWNKLFSSEGYIRLKKREESMKRSFSDTEFKAFLLADTIVRRASLLHETLQSWSHADIQGSARRALAYLPEGASIRATIYPVIKPRENSFVFEVNTNPAIFLYLDPLKTREQFENTLAHELHHIGYAGSCDSSLSVLISKKPEKIGAVMNWIGAFGEGFAMLAAAGGPEIHPHLYSKPADRRRWDHDMANFNQDLRKVEKFIFDILGSKLSKDSIQATGYSFFGVQGPWYTVGWKMAATIEKTYGRSKLIECVCDQTKLLSTYNSAALAHDRARSDSLAVWSSSLLKQISE